MKRLSHRCNVMDLLYEELPSLPSPESRVDVLAGVGGLLLRESHGWIARESQPAKAASAAYHFISWPLILFHDLSFHLAAYPHFPAPSSFHLTASPCLFGCHFISGFNHARLVVVSFHGTAGYFTE